MGERALVLLLVLALVGCESRPPVTRGQAVAIAAMWQQGQGESWSDPVEVLPPRIADDGHRWWQLRYRTGQVLLVDADSGWTRLPPPGFAVRLRSVGSPPPQAEATVVEEGTCILRLIPAEPRSPEAVAVLERRAAELNALAGRNGLHPLFGLQRDGHGNAALVYGWQGDRGIAREPRVESWLQRHAPDLHGTWIDLLPQ